MIVIKKECCYVLDYQQWGQEEGYPVIVIVIIVIIFFGFGFIFV